MVDRSFENQEIGRHPKELYRQGRDKPSDVEGYKWVPVRGLDPTKSPRETSGWRGIPLSAELGDEFVVPRDLQEEEQKKLLRETQLEAGVGSHATRTEAGMRRAEERAETIGRKQEKSKRDE